MPEKTCQYCHKTFTAKPSQLKTRKYCSMECSSKAWSNSISKKNVEREREREREREITPEIRQRLRVLKAWKDNGFLTQPEYEREVENLFKHKNNPA